VQAQALLCFGLSQAVRPTGSQLGDQLIDGHPVGRRDLARRSRDKRSDGRFVCVHGVLVLEIRATGRIHSPLSFKTTPRRTPRQIHRFAPQATDRHVAQARIISAGN